MARFYGSIQGRRATVHRLHYRSMEVIAAGWHGGVRVRLTINADGDDCYEVVLIPWNGEGELKHIASGVFHGKA